MRTLSYFVSYPLLSLLQERDEWVAELRVASRVVPLEDIFQIKALLRKGAFASVSKTVVFRESGTVIFHEK